MHTQGTDVKSKKVAQGLATRAALLSAARRLFGEHGYVGTATDDIVTAAGVTKGALYHHFGGKRQLFEVVFEQAKREASEQAANAFLEPDPWLDLLAGCRATLDAHLDPAVLRITLLDGRAVLSWDTVRRVESRYGAVILRGALRRAVNSGVLQPLPLRTMAEMLNGAIVEGCILIAEAPDRASAHQEVTHSIEQLLGGLRQPPRERHTPTRLPDTSQSVPATRPK
jgi:AcrR family transcriptional regulator